jgi:hypothetical protein
MKTDVIHAYLGYNIVAIKHTSGHFITNFKAISGKSASVNVATYCLNKVALCSASNVFDNIDKEIRNIGKGKI